MGLKWSCGSSNGVEDDQVAARPVVPMTSPGRSFLTAEEPSSAAAMRAGFGTEKNQGESSSSSGETAEDWDLDVYDPGTYGYDFSGNIIDEELEEDDCVSDEQASDAGVQLQRDPPRWKCWVDESTRANCIMLFARGLIITWGSDERYWSWRRLRQEEMVSPLCTEDTDVEVAYLKAVCWLEIRGSLDMSHLTPGFTYDVFFVAKLAPGTYGFWSAPVELQLTAPTLNGPCTVEEDIRRMKGKKGWSELKVGEVVVLPAPDGKTNGIVDVAMLRLDGAWKSGLTLLGIKIIPKSNSI